MLPNMRQHFTSSLAWSSHPEPGLRAGFVAPFGPGSVACLGTSPTIVRDPFLSCVAWASHVFRLTSGLGRGSPSLLVSRISSRPIQKPGLWRIVDADVFTFQIFVEPGDDMAQPLH